MKTSQTNLDGVNFKDADLRQASFRGAYLKNACFQGANLEAADFTGAFLGNTDFRGARYLEAAQIRAVDSGLAGAYYGVPLSAELGLDDMSEKPEPASC